MKRTWEEDVEGNNKCGKQKGATKSQRMRVATLLDWLSFSITLKFLKSFHNAFRFYFLSLFVLLLPSAHLIVCISVSICSHTKQIQCIFYSWMYILQSGREEKSKLFTNARTNGNLVIKATLCAFIHLFIYVTSYTVLPYKMISERKECAGLLGATSILIINFDRLLPN